MAEITYAEAIAQLLLGKEVDIFLGNSGAFHKLNDFDTEKKSIIHGVIDSVQGQCIIVKVTNRAGIGNLIYLNSWCIESIVEIKPFSLRLKDCYQEEDRQIRK